ncbi:MAG: amidohydrolase family protein, partial [Promethearchaeota archaeon]
MKIKLNEITNNDMKHNRIILENGLIINYNDRFIGDIIVENGMIVKVIKKANTEISKKSMRDNENSETNSFYNNSSQEIRIDCKGKYILPGIVDPHSHLRDMEQSYKETIETATQAALSNGITTILAMPNTIPPLSSIDTISNYMDLIKRKARNNVGIIAALRPPLCLGDFNELKRNNIYGIKVYPGAKSSSINLEWVPLIDAYHTLSKKYNDPFFSIDLLGGFRNFFGKILKDIREPVKGSISGPDQNNAGNNENNGDLIRFYRIINKYIDGPGASEFLKLLNKSASRVSRLYDDLKEILVQDNNYSYHNWSELFDRSRKYNIPLLFHPDVPLEKKELETRFNNFLSQNNNRSNKYLVAHSMTYSDLAEILHILYIGILLEEYFGNNARRVSSDAPLNTHPDNNSNISTGIPLNSPPKNKSDSENKLIIKFCHVSAHMSLLAIKLLEKLRLSDDIRFDIEVTPHHLFLNYNIEERLRK